MKGLAEHPPPDGGSGERKGAWLCEATLVPGSPALPPPQAGGGEPLLPTGGPGVPGSGGLSRCGAPPGGAL